VTSVGCFCLPGLFFCGGVSHPRNHVS
jgi:hypothetical protein